MYLEKRLMFFEMLKCRGKCLKKLKEGNKSINLKDSVGVIRYGSQCGDKKEEERHDAEALDKTCAFEDKNKMFSCDYNCRGALRQTTTECNKCRHLYQNLRAILDKINKQYETRKICPYCKMVNLEGYCKRCAYYMKGLTQHEGQLRQLLDQRYISFILKVKQSLENAINNELLCCHRHHGNLNTTLELERILDQLEVPLSTSQPIITEFPESVMENVIDRSIAQTKLNTRPNVSKKIASKSDIYKDSSFSNLKFTENGEAHKKNQRKILTKVITTTEQNKLPGTSAHTASVVNEKQGHKNKEIASKSNENAKTPHEIMLNLLKEIKPLPYKDRKINKNTEEDVFSSVLECNNVEETSEKVMIHRNKIVLTQITDVTEMEKAPLFFKAHHSLTDIKQKDDFDSTNVVLHSESSNSSKSTSMKGRKKLGLATSKSDAKGIIRYTLSDKKFIDNGWTMLPYIKTMKKVNLYKMVPSHPEGDWFKRHIKQRLIFYETGEILAEIDENACGKWYYKTGALAMDYYIAEDSCRRLVIYSSCKGIIADKSQKVRQLACFDTKGNCVVYDHFGQERLKYNQSEGIVADSKLEAPGKWKWHTLNDSPELRNVLVEPTSKQHNSRTYICNWISQNVKDSSKYKKLQEVVAQNPKNILKLKQKFHTLPIRTKVVKINEYFTLKIIAQENVKISFRCGKVCLTHNVGMLLLNDEIVGEVLTEASEVMTL